MTVVNVIRNRKNEYIRGRVSEKLEKKADVFHEVSVFLVCGTIHGCHKIKLV